ncbi:hypothetical protein HC928_03895 [bacterium]|nr:hypothetical protein [bacterium]
MMLSIPSLKYLLALLVLCGSGLGLTLASNMPPAAAQQELQITLLGTHTLPAPTRGLVVIGERAYVTYWSARSGEIVSGLQIVDVRNPASPVLLGDYFLSPRRPSQLVVTETAAIISFTSLGVEPEENQSGRGVLFLDIQDATAPQLLSIHPTADAGYLALEGNRLYIGINFPSPPYSQVDIMDISDTMMPTLLGTYDPPNEQNQIAGLAAQGNTVYLGGFDTGFTVIDVSDPGNPTLIGRWTTPGPPSVRPVVEGDRGVRQVVAPQRLTLDEAGQPHAAQPIVLLHHCGSVRTRKWFSTIRLDTRRNPTKVGDYLPHRHHRFPLEKAGGDYIQYPAIF